MGNLHSIEVATPEFTSCCLQEEKAELKALNYLLEKEKGAMQLQLSGKESQAHAYLIQIDHLKSEITEQTRGYSHGKVSSRAPFVLIRVTNQINSLACTELWPI